MKRLGLEQEVVDRDVYEHTLARFRERRIVSRDERVAVLFTGTERGADS